MLLSNIYIFQSVCFIILSFVSSECGMCISSWNLLKHHEINLLGASIEHESSKLAPRSKLIAVDLGKYLPKICLFSEPATNLFKFQLPDLLYRRRHATLSSSTHIFVQQYLQC